MFLISDCSDRTARMIDKHVLSVPLTLMMGRRYFFAELAQFMTIELLMFNCRGGIGLENRHS